MKPQLFALLTAIAWGVGGYFEKKGLHYGNLSQQMGITIRTAIALIVLAVVSFPYWKTVPQAGTKALLYMIIGGGIVAGSVGMLCFYLTHREDSFLASHVPPSRFPEWMDGRTDARWEMKGD